MLLHGGNDTSSMLFIPVFHCKELYSEFPVFYFLMCIYHKNIGLIPYIAKSQLHRMLFAGRNISNGSFLFAEILLLVMISS